MKDEERYQKVVKGLTQCTSFGEIGLTEDECGDCPYYAEGYKTGLCWVEMNRDALAMLKEQETIIEQYSRADGFLAAHGWKWEDGDADE